MAEDNQRNVLNVDQQLVATSLQDGEQVSRSERRSGLYANPWDTWNKPSIWAALKWQMTKNTPPLPSKAELDQKLPVQAPDWDRIRNPPKDQIQVTFMGHASFLVQMDGLNFLTDPVWSDRCSPLSFAGPARYRPAPCQLSEMPPIDFVLISHNHYDHLDITAVRHFRNDVLWIVPDGHRSWFKSEGIDRVIELKWWDTYPVNDKVQVGCLPAQHWSKRTLTDDMHALWSGWGVFGAQQKLFFAGDTGYCAGFQEIGQKFGPFDLALIPIGAYEPRDFMRCQHVNPADAVCIHQDIRAKQSIGMHWGTWVLTDEHVFEPPQKLAEELAAKNIDQHDFIALNHGQSFTTGEKMLSPILQHFPNAIPQTQAAADVVEVDGHKHEHKHKHRKSKHASSRSPDAEPEAAL